MTSSERKAVFVLCLWLVAGIALDLVLQFQPHPIALILGDDRLDEILATGGDGGRGSPPRLPGPRAGGDGRDPVSSPARPETEHGESRLPYDRQGRLAINLADSTSLQHLKGVGPVLARRILKRRSQLGGFGGPEDLLTVRGIGPKTLAKLLPQVSFGVAKDLHPETGKERQ